MPTRMLRDWTDSDKIDRLSPGAERFFTRLIMKADDYGRYHGDTQRLRAFLFPLKTQIRDTDISGWIAECVRARLILCYEAGGRALVEIAQFGQRLRSMKSSFPPPGKDPPPSDVREPPSDDGHLRADDGNPPPEGKGSRREGEGNARARGSSQIPDRQTAIAQTVVSGVDPAFAGYVYDQWALRDGKDAASCSVPWLGYCTQRWNKERAEWMAGTHRGKPKLEGGKPSENHVLRGGKWVDRADIGPNI